MEKNVPTGVKIIAVLDYIGAAITALLGILLLVGAGVAGSLIARVPGLQGIAAGAVGVVLAVIGVIFIALAVLSYFIARGLWKGQNWARIVKIIFAVLGVLNGLLALFGGSVGTGIFYIAIFGLIGGYLWFNKDVKAVFS